MMFVHVVIIKVYRPMFTGFDVFFNISQNCRYTIRGLHRPVLNQFKLFRYPLTQNTANCEVRQNLITLTLLSGFLLRPY